MVSDQSHWLTAVRKHSKTKKFIGWNDMKDGERWDPGTSKVSQGGTTWILTSKLLPKQNTKKAWSLKELWQSDTKQHLTITNEANKSVMAGRLRWLMKCQAPDFAVTFGPTAKGNSLTCNQKSYMQPRVRWRYRLVKTDAIGTRNKRGIVKGTVRIRNRFTIGWYTTKHTKYTETCITCLIWQPAPWQFFDIARVHPAI